MKKIYLTLIFFAICFPLASQGMFFIFGEIVLQNSKYNSGTVKYIQGANIKAFKAIPTTSDEQGRFSLRFDNVFKGSSTQLIINKLGYEVVNEKEINNSSIVGKSTPIKIVMCKQGELDKNRIIYYDIALGSIKEKYEKSIKELNAGGARKDSLISMLQMQNEVVISNQAEAIKILESRRDEALKQAKTISEKFAEVNLDDADSLYLSAYEAFLKRDFDKVLNILNYDILYLNIANAKNNILINEQIIKESDQIEAKNIFSLNKSMESALYGARASRNIGKHLEAIKYYNLAISIDSSNIDNLVELFSYINQVILEKPNLIAVSNMLLDSISVNISKNRAALMNSASKDSLVIELHKFIHAIQNFNLENNTVVFQKANFLLEQLK